MKTQGVLALSSLLLVALPLRMAGVAEHCWYTYCGTSALNEPGWNCHGGGFPGGGGPGGGPGGGGKPGGGGPGGGGGSGNGGCRGCGSGGEGGGFWGQPHVEPHYETLGPGSSGMVFQDWLESLIAVPFIPYGAGAQGGACPDEQCSAAGMPAWWISEPYVSLHVEDEPLGYQPALGPRVSFHLAYRQRGNVAVESGVFGVGTNWTCSFRAWLTASNGYAYVHRGGAGVVRYGVGQPDFRDGTVVAWEDNVGWVLETRTGAKAVFGTLVTIGQEDRYFLSAQYDPTGNGMTYTYSTSGGEVRLTAVTDGDGQSTTLSYGTGVLTNRIVRVDDPFGRYCLLGYDGTGRLTNVTDVASLASGFQYDARGWITNLVTPYGATGFRYGGCDAETEEAFFTGGYAINRVIEVSEPSGGHQLFLYQHTSTNTASPPVPNTTATLGISNQFDTAALENRNSYHWGPRQYDALSASYLSSGNATNLTADDFAVAHLRHWLLSEDASFLMSDTLSVERMPSPQAGESGQWTWYDHPDKPAADKAGSWRLASLVGRVLPNQTGLLTNWLVRFERNSRGLVTQREETWTQENGTLGVRTDTFAYYGNGIDLYYHTDPGSSIIAYYEYNGRHQVTTAANALWEYTYFSYDEGTYLLTNITYPSGLSSGYSYDNTSHRLLSLTNAPIGESRSFTYSANGLPYSTTDARGLTTWYTWDALQRLTSVIHPDATTISNRYDKLDLVASKDRLGRWSSHLYGPGRELLFTTNAAGVVTAYGHCTCGGLVYVTNAWGTSQAEGESYLYDRQGRRTVTLLADGTGLTNTYNSLGQVVARTDGLVTLGVAYNNQGLPVSASTDCGTVQTAVYDVHDRPVTVTDANNVTVAQTYDVLHRLTTRTWPDNGYEQWGYSANVAAATSHTNQLGWETWSGYDAAGRKLYETNANQEVLAYYYTPAGDLWTLTDGKGQVTTWHYDSYGRVTNKFDQTSTSILRYTYDANGALATHWSAAKGTASYAYDWVGNLTNIDYPASVDLRLQYDAHQRLTNLVDAVGTSVFGYWPGGQLRFEDGPWASDTLTNTYTRGRRTALLLQQPAGSWTNAFGYDTAGRLTNVTSPAGIFGYDYRVGPSVSPALLVRKLLLPSGAYITNDFDSVGRLLFTKLLTSGGVVTNSHSYDYNVASQRLRGTLGEGSSYSYSYDPIGQLSHARFTNALGQSVSGLGRDYAYDAAWNLAWRTNGGAAQQFVANPKNELTNSTPTVAQTYDANGNLLTREQGQWTYSYDDANQLRWLVKSNASLPEAWTELVYDGLGRLRVRREYAWIGYVEPDDPELASLLQALSAMVESSSGGHWYLSNEVRYVYDGRRVIQERDTNNVPQVSYTRGRDLSGSLEGAGGIGGLLGRSHGYGSGDDTWSTHNYYHADGNGNVTFLLAANQTLAARYAYDPYGSTVSQTGSLADANVYRFSSKEHHAGSGLYYYLYRWYDPGTQRWINRDPIQEWGGG